MKQKKKKTPLTAREKAKRGMIIAPIFYGLCYLGVFLMLAASGEGTAELLMGLPTLLLVLLVSPIWGFGFAFNYPRMLEKLCRRLHYSGEIALFSILAYYITKNRDHLFRGVFLAMLIPVWTVGVGWIPGVFSGRKELKAEYQAEKEAAAGRGKEFPGFWSWFWGKPNTDGTTACGGKSPGKSQRSAPASNPAAAHQTVPRQTVTAAAPQAVRRGVSGTLCCLAGAYAGASIPAEPDRELVLGRDPTQCNLILAGSDISRVHCKISYDGQARIWRVIDLSSNGTFAGADRLKNGVYERVPNGTVLTLGRGAERFRLQA